MAGLSLGAGAQVRAGSQPTYGSVSGPSSAATAGFGAGTPSTNSNGGSVLSPGSTAGLSLWIGVGSLVLLWAFYHSLPA